VYKERLCNVVLQYVPVTFDPTAKGALEVVGNDNSLPRGVLTKVRWIKPLERHREGQRVAHAIFGFSDPRAANAAIREGLWVDGSKVHGHQLLSEPVRCLKCQGMVRPTARALCSKISYKGHLSVTPMRRTRISSCRRNLSRG
jgi:hypothetical protein